MLNFLLIILGITFFSSVLILSKYIDFAKFIIDQKDKNPEPRVIQFNRPREFKRKVQQDIIIDIPVEEVKVLQYKGD
jgi:hypothetical protein